MTTPLQHFLLKKGLGAQRILRPARAGGLARERRLVSCDVACQPGGTHRVAARAAPEHRVRIKKGTCRFTMNATQARLLFEPTSRDFVAVATDDEVMRTFFEANPSLDRSHMLRFLQLVPRLVTKGWEHLLAQLRADTTGLEARLDLGSGISFAGRLADNTVGVSSVVGTAAAAGEIGWSSAERLVHRLRPASGRLLVVNRGNALWVKVKPPPPPLRTWTTSTTGAARFGGLLSLVGTELEYALDDDKQFWSVAHVRDLIYSVGKGAAATAAGAAAGALVAGVTGLMVGFVVAVFAAMLIDDVMETLGQMFGVMVAMIARPAVELFRTFRFSALARRDLETLATLGRQPHDPLPGLLGRYVRWLVGGPTVY